MPPAPTGGLPSLRNQVMAKEKTKSFVLRLDADTMSAVEKWAVDEFRSTNGQQQWIIAEALRKAKRMPKRRSVTADTQDEVEPENSK